MADYDDEEKLRKTFGIFPQRIIELDRQIANLEKDRIDQTLRDVEILLKEKQAELSQLFLLDNLSVFQAAQLLAWSNEISDYHINESSNALECFHAIDKILTTHFEKVNFTLPIIEEGVLSGEIECQIYRTPTDDTSIDRTKSTITKSAVRKWLLKKSGYFSSGFFPEIINSEDWESIRQGMLSEQEACATARLDIIEEPPLITLKRATEEGKLEKSDLLQIASKGQDTLELLVYVFFKDIVGGVKVPSTSCEPGYFLALPSYIFTRVVNQGDAYVNSFLLPKTYDQPDSGAGLVMLRQIVAESRDRTIKTRERYYLTIDQEKIWVVRQHAKRFFKKSDEKTPTLIVQEQPGHAHVQQRITLIGTDDGYIYGKDSIIDKIMGDFLNAEGEPRPDWKTCKRWIGQVKLPEIELVFGKGGPNIKCKLHPHALPSLKKKYGIYRTRLLKN